MEKQEGSEVFSVAKIYDDPFVDSDHHAIYDS